MPMTTMAAEEMLDEFQMDKLHHLMPVIVIMVIVCVFGIVGNSFTVAFYGFVAKRTPTIFLITVLACVDLIVCILIVPQVIEMAVNVKFTSAAACKLMHFFGHWAIVTSTETLWFIAVDRYRHVCCPLKTQMSIAMVKRASVIIIVLSLLLSIRDFFTFDIIEFSIGNDGNNATVMAHYCTERRDARYKTSVTVFHIIEAVFIILILFTLCFTYGRIVWTIRKSGLAATTNKEACFNESNEEGETKQTDSRKSPADIESSAGEDDTKPTQDNIAQRGYIQRVPKSNTKIKGTERSITLMMSVVSLVFGFCFIPYFVVKIAIRSYSSAGELELGVGSQLAIRLIYVNSFANPVVFCFFNPQFRQYIRGTVMKLKPGPAGATTSTKLSSQNCQ